MVNLRLGLSKDLLPSSFHTKTLYMFISFPVLAHVQLIYNA